MVVWGVLLRDIKGTIELSKKGLLKDWIGSSLDGVGTGNNSWDLGISCVEICILFRLERMGFETSWELGMRDRNMYV